jgi:hypothetical protein
MKQQKKKGLKARSKFNFEKVSKSYASWLLHDGG